MLERCLICDVQLMGTSTTLVRSQLALVSVTEWAIAVTKVEVQVAHGRVMIEAALMLTCLEEWIPGSNPVRFSL